MAKNTFGRRIFNQSLFSEINSRLNRFLFLINNCLTDTWYHKDLKKQEDLRNSLVSLGVTPLWHVAQWGSRAPPHHTLPAFLSSAYLKLLMFNIKWHFDPFWPPVNVKKYAILKCVRKVWNDKIQIKGIF